MLPFDEELSVETCSDMSSVNTLSSTNSGSLAGTSASGEEMCEGSASGKSTSGSKVAHFGKVTFCDDVQYRQVYMDENSDDEDEIEDTHQPLKRGDYSTPCVAPVSLSEEERRVRSRLVGALPAEKRIRHDFARMYGCGRTIRTCAPIDLDDIDIDKILKTQPVREIHAHAPSAFWFGGK